MNTKELVGRKRKNYRKMLEVFTWILIGCTVGVFESKINLFCKSLALSIFDFVFMRKFIAHAFSVQRFNGAETIVSVCFRICSIINLLDKRRNFLKIF